MKLADLQRTHECYDADAMQRCQDLFEGGERMRKRASKYLQQNDVEPDPVFRKRCEAAHYVNHAGAIGGYLAAFLFSKPLQFDGGNESFWGDFKEDCDGLGTDFDNFLRARFVEALEKQRAYFAIETPTPVAPVSSMADFRALGRTSLRAIPTEAITDWQKDSRGRYVWMLERQIECFREGPGADETETLTYTQWRADGKHRRWETTYAANQGPGANAEIPEIEPPVSPLQGIPIVSLELPPDLWLMGHLASPQLAYFRLYCSLLWGQNRTCYPMPVFKLADKQKPPVMGAGYYIMIGADEDAGWIAPPSTPFDSIKASLDGLKDEIYRVSQAMARGVNNNAAALGRSGESKQADDRATEIVVDAYAERVKEVAQNAVNLIASVTNEEAPTVKGMTGYAVVDAKATLEAAMLAKELGIPSVTFHKKMAEEAVSVIAPKLDENTRRQIAKEIDEGVTPESIDPVGSPTLKLPPFDGSTP